MLVILRKTTLIMNTVCIQRLLAAANYDVAKAERGIICLDEIDKIATAKVSHGKDVSGEGVQQALLKIIEGTTVQVQAKQERSSNTPSSGAAGRTNPPSGYPTNSPLGGGNTNTLQPSKGEIYNINTDNILFICSGAFIGLHKAILDRISRGSIGFGAPVRPKNLDSSSDVNDTNFRGKGDDELFRKHLPFYTPPTPLKTLGLDSGSNTSDEQESTYNVLDLVTPTDLQRYGLIPELIGRIPITCALTTLSISALVRVLTEPRNSLLSQYTALFSLSGAELRFTTPALHEVAKSAAGMGTGARGLRTVMERLLGEAMFECPGSGVRFVLVGERCSKKEEGPTYLGKGQQGRFHALINEEEEAWESRKGGSRSEDVVKEKEGVQTFEQYREKAKVAGSG